MLQEEFSSQAWSKIGFSCLIQKIPPYSIPDMGKGTKRTYQPSKRKRARKHGFLARSKNILTKRRRKGRKRLA